MRLAQSHVEPPWRPADGSEAPRPATRFLAPPGGPQTVSPISRLSASGFLQRGLRWGQDRSLHAHEQELVKRRASLEGWSCNRQRSNVITGAGASRRGVAAPFPPSWSVRLRPTGSSCSGHQRLFTIVRTFRRGSMRNLRAHDKELVQGGSARTMSSIFSVNAPIRIPMGGPVLQYRRFDSASSVLFS